MCKSESACFLVILKQSTLVLLMFLTISVCNKPIIQVFQVMINLFVYLFNEMIQIKAGFICKMMDCTVYHSIMKISYIDKK